MPFVSVIVPTMRVGGMDVLLDSLAKQTFRDFELVLADGLRDRRRGVVAERARAYPFPVQHTCPTPNPFPLNAFCAYANAGLVAARGEVALFCVDYTSLPENLVEIHAAFHRRDATGRAGLMAPHQYYTLDVRPDFPHYSNKDPADTERYTADALSGRLDAFMWSTGDDRGQIDPIMRDTDPKLRLQAGPVDSVFFHAKNESVRLEHCLAVNGWDEDLDGTHCYQDSDFSDRLTVHRGVHWHVDPSPAAVARIVNPRHAFPYARRLREPETNHQIWLGKKARGYPDPVNKWNLRDRRTAERCVPKADDPPAEFGSTAMGDDRLSVAMVYGEFSSAIHGPFDIPGLYRTQALTGSESSFFNLARTLAERGHRVAVFCVCDQPVEHPSGFVAMPIQTIRGLPQMRDLDAIVAWNETDYLEHAPPGVLRVVDQQLNDWGYCRRVPTELADIFVFPSQGSLNNHGPQLGKFRAAVVPNSVDLDLFGGHHAVKPVARHPRRVVYSSSPDRGLHHLLSFWPEVRRRVPDAELKIFYRLEPWLQGARGLSDEVGRRARYVEIALERLRDGWGVEVVGPVANERMARELQAATVLAYPCDPVRYTEGFGCSVLDAAAGGCLPIISKADALEEVHGRATVRIGGKPSDQRDIWIEAISAVLSRQPADEGAEAMRVHAEAHSREHVADQWEVLLWENLSRRA